MSSYIITDRYEFTRLAGCKSQLRMDCTASTKSYEPFEAIRNAKGNLYVYLGESSYIKAAHKRKADLAMSHNTHISSIYVLDVATSTDEASVWYGDFKDTADALLIIAHNFEMVNGSIQDGAWIEVFVARGQKHSIMHLYNRYCNGDFDAEIARLREISGADMPPTANTH